MAHAIAVRDIGRGAWAVPARPQPARVRPAAHVAAVAASRVRHALHRVRPGVLRGRQQRLPGARLPAIPRTLPPGAPLAGSRFQRGGIRGHMEPPLVPGLSVGLQHAAGSPVAPAPFTAGRPPGSLAGASTPRCPDVAAGRPVLRLPRGAGAPVSTEPRPGRRLVPACRVFLGVPARLRGCATGHILVQASRPALANARGGTGRDERRAAAQGGRAIPAGWRYTTSACADPMGPHRTRRAGAVLVVGTAGDLRLGLRDAQPADAMAALCVRGGVPLVHPAPEPDRPGGVLAGSVAARAVA